MAASLYILYYGILSGEVLPLKMPRIECCKCAIQLLPNLTSSGPSKNDIEVPGL